MNRRQIAFAMLFAIALMAAPLGLQLAIGQNTTQSLEQNLQRAKQLQNRKAQVAEASDTQIEQLAAQAATSYRARNFPLAVQQYDRAAAVAFRSGAVGRAFEFSLVAAELQRSQSDWLDAADRFERAALANANDPRAAATHYAACQALSSAASQPNASPSLLVRLDRMLQSHQANWPKAKTAPQAGWQRVELLVLRKAWSELLTVVRQVKSTDVNHPRAQQLMLLAHGQRFDAALASDTKPTEQAELLTKALVTMSKELEPILFGNQNRWPTQWSATQQQTALLLSRSHLSRGKAGADYAKQMLSIALKSVHRSEQTTYESMTSVYAIAALITEDLAAADTQLATLMPNTHHRRSLLRKTQQRLATAEPTTWAVEADQLLETIVALQGNSSPSLIANSTAGASIDPVSTAVTNLPQVDALIVVGRRTEALKLLNDLIAATPNDRRYPIARAKLLASSNDPKQQEQALRSWHEIEARTPKGTEVWFVARLERLRLLKTLDRQAEALKLFKLTQLLAPTLGGDALRTEFESLF